MDNKAFLDAPSYEMENPKTHHVIKLLSLTVGVLALCVVAMIGFTTIYISHANGECINDAATKEPTEMSSYELDINVDQTAVHERVVVNEQERTEFVINSDPESGHITNLAFQDYKTNITGMYASKEKTCFLLRMNHASTDFEKSLEQLKQLDGGMVETPVELEYGIGDRVETVADIPEQLRPYCSAGNTFWLVQMKEGARGKRAAVAAVIAFATLLFQLLGII